MCIEEVMPLNFNQTELNRIAKDFLKEYVEESKLTFTPYSLQTEDDLLAISTKLRIAKGYNKLTPEYYFILQCVIGRCARLGIEEEDMLFGII